MPSEHRALCQCEAGGFLALLAPTRLCTLFSQELLLTHFSVVLGESLLLHFPAYKNQGCTSRTLGAVSAKQHYQVCSNTEFYSSLPSPLPKPIPSWLHFHLSGPITLQIPLASEECILDSRSSWMFISISYSRRVLQNCLPAFWCYIWGLKVVPPTFLFSPGCTELCPVRFAPMLHRCLWVR